MIGKKIVTIALGGVTCGGKSTTSIELSKLISKCKVFCQDDYFFPVNDSRHVWVPELNHINFDILSSLDMEKMTNDILLNIQKESCEVIQSEVEHPHLPHPILCFDSQKSEYLYKINKSQTHVIIIEGFCILNHKPLADLCDLKYYFTLNYDECYRRRLNRVYEPPDCPGYFEKVAWPEHLKQLAEVKENVKNVVYFDENSTNHVEEILGDIVKLLK